jgi:hypothetical protein
MHKQTSQSDPPAECGAGPRSVCRRLRSDSQVGNFLLACIASDTWQRVGRVDRTAIGFFAGTGVPRDFVAAGLPRSLYGAGSDHHHLATGSFRLSRQRAQQSARLAIWSYLTDRACCRGCLAPGCGSIYLSACRDCRLAASTSILQALAFICRMAGGTILKSGTNSRPL